MNGLSLQDEGATAELAQTEEAQAAVPANVDPAVLAQAQAEAEAQVAAEQQAGGAQAAAAPAEAPAAEAPAAAEAAPADAAQVDATAQAGADAQAQAQAQAEAEAQAQAQAQAQAEAEAQAQAAPKATTVTKKIAVPNTPDINQAAAVAAAAAQLMPEDKPWSKMTPAEKAAKQAKDAAEKKRLAEKEARENPTVDENGEHIQTVAEAKAEAAQLQQMLVQGEAAVEQKIQMQQEQLAREPAVPAEPVKQEEDDGHIETVEEAKAKMAAAQKAMEEGIANTDNKVK